MKNIISNTFFFFLFKGGMQHRIEKLSHTEKRNVTLNIKLMIHLNEKHNTEQKINGDLNEKK